MIEQESSERPSEMPSVPSQWSWQAREQGKAARRARKPPEANPYPYGTQYWECWSDGYIHQQIHYG